MPRPFARWGRVGRVLVSAVSAAMLCSACDARDVADATLQQNVSPAKAAQDLWVADIDSLALRVDALDSAAVRLTESVTSGTVAEAQQAFAAARVAFKRVEFLAAYYEPSTTRAMNGPALPRVEDEEGPEAVFPPEGFQVIEELLFPAPAAESAVDMLNEIRNLRAYVTRLHTAASHQNITDDRLFDAAKLQIARVVSLGVTGFDSPVAQLSMREAAASLRGMRDMLSVYRQSLGGQQWAPLDSAFSQAIASLSDTVSFNAFDRLGFIATKANPLARSLVRARDQLAIGTPDELRAFRVTAVTLFDEDAFDAHAFASPASERATPAQVALGHALFFEPRVSGNGAVACASCHEPSRAFTDGRTRSVARSGGSSLRNAPTVINSGLQSGSFYDLRTTYLEDQISDVVSNAEEMHSSVERAAASLAGDARYQQLFSAAFEPAQEGSLTGHTVRVALAAYLRSLQALNSRVDQALRGDTMALSLEERHGLNLFMGKGKCATCHFAPLYNGTVPPMYTESEVEVIGVPATNVVRRARIDPDSGRFHITRSTPHLHAFKTPSVRNAALTAPYMHNGVYASLEEVVDFYNRGGGVGIGASVENQTLPADTLGLTANEQRALVRFMEALTDTVGVTARVSPSGRQVVQHTVRP